MGAYPRERGGTDLRNAPAFFGTGLSPRARGNLSRIPRVAGRAGLSPRARGNHHDGPKQFACGGPIPASAGEPWPPLLCFCARRAYPRERGGTAEAATEHITMKGLSPRARGNHLNGCQVFFALGPIPASAGEPLDAQARLSRLRAYPRERGGTGSRPSGPPL